MKFKMIENIYNQDLVEWMIQFSFKNGLRINYYYKKMR